MSFTRLTYHIIIGTKSRQQTIPVEHEKEVYALLLSLIQRHNGYVHRIGGMPDHVHMLVDLPPTCAVSDVVRVLKQATSLMMKGNPHFPMWSGWAEGYAAFSYDRDKITIIINYIKGQKEHHKTVSFRDEYRDWLIEQGISPDDPYFPE